MATIRTTNGMKSWAAIGPTPPITAVPPEGIVTTSALNWTEPGPMFDVLDAATRARPALSRIQVRGELDGRLDLFGSRFWKLIQERSTPARQWLDTGKVIHVEYDDRYLFNPLAIALLAAVLKSIPGKVAKEADRPTATIRTLTDRSGDVRQSQPYAIFHDWSDSAMRDYVLKSASTSTGFNVSLETASRSSLPHGRTLRLRHGEGMALDIMLDQGFGYWRSRTGSFDFAAPPSEQARSVISGNISVVGSQNHSTTFIVEVLNPDDTSQRDG